MRMHYLDKNGKFATNAIAGQSTNMLRFDSIRPTLKYILEIGAQRGIALKAIRLNQRQVESEVVMASYTQPTKQTVRAYLERRSRDPKPPPSPAEIRRQLGWDLTTFPPVRPSRRA
jgi:hypothetical protein